MSTNTSTKMTVLTNVFNEEYLLPFWLEHHKKIFDHGIIVDYRSTDRSMEICRAICPTWTIITSKNEKFGAFDIDREFVELENEIEGIKIVLNTTEFLCSVTPIKSIFQQIPSPISLSANQISAYSLRADFYPNSLQELFSSLLHPDVMFAYSRGARHIHNHKNGNYTVGRHLTHHPMHMVNDIFIFWFGRYPFNPSMEKRILQIKQNIPESDIRAEMSIHHLITQSEIYPDIQMRYKYAIPLKVLNFIAYNYLLSYR